MVVVDAVGGTCFDMVVDWVVWVGLAGLDRGGDGDPVFCCPGNWLIQMVPH
jgi:hypothetical protein